MPLENLLTLIEKIQERINRHGDALRKSEALTRYTLIDPLLRELGWDTEDPALVKPEYGSGKGFADYALFSNDGPIMMLEAKKLDESLVGARRQAVDYAMDETGIKTRYLSVTDGACWEIYDTNKPVADMLAASFDLKSPSAAAECLKALALWRPSVISGQIAVGESPIIGLPDDQQSTTEPRPTEETTVQPDSLNLAEDDWEPLSELNPQTGDPKPTAILFPDNSRASINTWKALMVEVARWLINNKYLEQTHCPIKYSDRVKRYIVSTTAIHPNQKSFKSDEHIGGLHIETNYSSRYQVKNARTIIQHVNQDPAQFKVRFPGP